MLNRFYTCRAAFLPYLGRSAPTEVQFHELAHSWAQATELARELAWTAATSAHPRAEQSGWLSRAQPEGRARACSRSLTPGMRLAPRQKSRDEAAALLARWRRPSSRRWWTRWLHRAAAEPHGRAAHARPLREPRPGDMGWVAAARRGLRARVRLEHGLEALVADIAKYVRELQPDWERCWTPNSTASAWLSLRGAQPSTAQRAAAASRARGLPGRADRRMLAFARARATARWCCGPTAVHGGARDHAKRGSLVKSEPYEGFGQSLKTWELKLEVVRG